MKSRFEMRSTFASWLGIGCAAGLAMLVIGGCNSGGGDAVTGIGAKYVETKDGHMMMDLVRPIAPVMLGFRKGSVPADKVPPGVVEASPFTLSWPVRASGIVAKGSTSDPSYSKVFIDANADGAFSEGEEAHQCSGSASDGIITFGPVTLPSNETKAECKTLLVYVIGKNYMYALPDGYFEGEVTFDGKTMKYGVMDSNMTGRLGDLSKQTGQADYLLVDWNGNGEFDRRMDERDKYQFGLEVIDLPAVLVTPGGTPYEVGIPEDGKGVGFQRSQDKMATLETDASTAVLMMEGPKGMVRAFSKGGKVTVPAGKYSVKFANLGYGDDAGKLWSATLMFGGKPMDLDLQADTTTKFEAGKPFQAVVDQTPLLGECRLTVHIQDRNGVQVFDLRQPDMSLPRPPDMAISDKNGVELSLMPFHYGCSLLCMLTWRPTEAAKNPPFYASTHFNLGPLGDLKAKSEISVNGSPPNRRPTAQPSYKR